MHNFNKISAFLLLLLFIPPLSYAADIAFEVTVDRQSGYVGSSIKLNLNFYGTQDMPMIDLPDIEGFRWNYMGPSSRLSIVNNKSTSSITHTYTLYALKEGSFEIPSFTVKYRGKSYVSKAIKIKIEKPKQRFSQPKTKPGSNSYDNALSLDDRAFIVMEIGKKSAYINENIPITIRLYINELSLRDIQYPELEVEGLILGEYGKAKQYRENLGGLLYEVVEFNRDVLLMRPGKLTIGPAQLKCNLLLRKKSSRRSPFSLFGDDHFGSGMFGDFFSSYERHPIILSSLEKTITVMPLPEENVPPGYDGAVGDYVFHLEAGPSEVKVGDPVTLKMIVAGNGNFNTVNAPHLDFKNTFKIYDPEITQEENRKIFEQVIIPKTKDIYQIPAVSFSSFNTETGRYETITKGPIPIKVNPLPRGEEQKVFELPDEFKGKFQRKEILGRDIIYIKDSPGKLKQKNKVLCKNKAFVALQALPLFAIILTFVFHKRKKRLQTDISYARRLRAPRKARKNLKISRGFLETNEPARFYDALFKSLQEYLGDKFHLPTAGITSSVINDLKGRNVPHEILKSIQDSFSQCDMARYAPSNITKEDMSKSFELLQEIIDKLERIHL